MRFNVEQLNGDAWSLVASEVEADGPHAAEMAAARGAADAGIYRVHAVGHEPDQGVLVRVPPYGPPEALG